MLIILGTFSMVFLLLVLGFIGELIGGLFASGEEESTEAQYQEDESRQLATC